MIDTIRNAPPQSQLWFQGAHYKIGIRNKLFRWDGFDWRTTNLPASHERAVRRGIEGAVNPTGYVFIGPDGVEHTTTSLRDFGATVGLSQYELAELIGGIVGTIRGFSYRYAPLVVIKPPRPRATSD